jgi:hypothetical protein
VIAKEGNLPLLKPKNIPSKDPLQSKLRQIQSDPFNLKIFPQDELNKMKNRKLIRVKVEKNLKISKGKHWRLPGNALQFKFQLHDEDLSSHRARYYQGVTKYFREKRNVQDCIQDVLLNLDKVEKYRGMMKELPELARDAIFHLLTVNGEAAGVVMVKIPHTHTHLLFNYFLILLLLLLLFPFAELGPLP